MDINQRPARKQAIEHGGPFKVILADPPWAYRQNNQHCRGGAATHYRTMADEDIAALPVGDFATDDALLVMWATWPKMDVAIDVLRSWGFTHVTAFPWIKTYAEGTPKLGIGMWFRGVSEFVIVARKGTFPVPKFPGGAPMGLAVGEDVQFYSTSPTHSKKPNGLHQWLDCLPGPRLELFARREMPGWTCWGGDLGWWITPEGIERDDTPRMVQGDLFGS